MKFKYLVLAAAGVLLIGGFIVLKPKDSTSSNIPTSLAEKTFDITVKNRRLVSGGGTLNATQGDKITLRITVDENEGFHLHGYDKSLELEKDKPAEIQFTADKPGSFEYELENSGTQLGFLQVSPR